MNPYLLGIDNEFIRQWEPRYDEKNHDEGEYQQLIQIVADEISERHTLSGTTFRRILDWKAARVKRKIKWDQYEVYAETIRNCIVSTSGDLMRPLVDLPGIGAPIASTLLHFIFPNAYPMFDFRTVAVLHAFGYLRRQSTSITAYPVFRIAILQIQAEHSQWNLRQIDRALFAYHQINEKIFNPCGSSTPIRRPRAHSHSQTQ